MLKKSIIISIVSFLVSIISFINQTFVASFFGTKKVMDEFFAITSFPLLLGALINISLSYYLTPHLKKKKLSLPSEYHEYSKLLLRKLTLYALFLFFVGTIASIGLNYFFYNILFSSYTIVLFSCCIIASFVSVIIAFFTSFFSVEEQFNLPLLVSFLPYFCSILCIIAFHKFLFALSIQLGIVIGSLLSCYILFKKSGLVYHQHTSEKNFVKEIRNFLWELPYVSISMLSFTIYQSIDSYWAPKLGVSNLAYLAYAQRIIVAIGIVIITGPSAILVSKLTEYAVYKDDERFYLTAIDILKVVVLLSSLLAVSGSILRNLVIQLVFERGNFSHSDTLAVANLLPSMLLGMCFMLCFTVLYRIYFIKSSPKKSSIIGIISAILYFLLSGLASSYLGILGITYAYAATWIFVFLMLFLVTFKNAGRYVFNSINLKFIGHIAILCTVSYYLLDFLFNKNSFFYAKLSLNSVFVQLVILEFISVFVFIFIGLYILRMPILKNSQIYLKEFVNNRKLIA
ncbi:MAG: lipid II flippase MurJ [Flavobacterium sp.]|nr:lipid II flippase MurJ [Flavobacterium sp.]